MRLLLLHVGAPIASILVTSRFATSFQELRAVYWQEKRDAMAWFSAVVQDVRSRSNGLRESCLAVVWSLQKISDEVGWTNHFRSIQFGLDTPRSSRTGKGIGTRLGRFPLSCTEAPRGLSSYIMLYSQSTPNRTFGHWSSSVYPWPVDHVAIEEFCTSLSQFQVLAMKSPAFNQHFFPRRHG